MKPTNNSGVIHVHVVCCDQFKIQTLTLEFLPITIRYSLSYYMYSHVISTYLSSFTDTATAPLTFVLVFVKNESQSVCFFNFSFIIIW